MPAFGPATQYGWWFMAFQAACGLACIVLIAVALNALDQTGPRLYGPVAFAALAPLALGPLTLLRYDLWPTAFVAAALAALLTARIRLGLGALAAGTLAKIFPAVLVPLVLLRARGADARRAGAVFAAVILIVVVPFAVVAPAGLASSLERQLGRELQIETLGGSALLIGHVLGAFDPAVTFGAGSWNLSGRLPDVVAAGQTALQLGAVLAVWIVFLRTGRTRWDLVVAAAAAIGVWMTFGKVLSPQFQLWLLPPVAILASRRLLPPLLLIAAFALSRLVFRAGYGNLVALERTPTVLLAARNVVLVALTVVLALELWRGVADGRSVSGPDA